MMKRTKILDSVRQGNFTSAQAKIMCRDARGNLKEGISVAKLNWTSCLSEWIHAMSQNSRDSWKSVNILKSWTLGHHKSPDIMRFEKDDGTFTMSDEEIIEILSKHFHKVYNSNVEIDWSILDELIQRKTYSSMNLPLSIIEFNKAILKLILHKAPGANGISPNVIKGLNDENKSHLFKDV